ncbi:hypothetical protein Gpo141_00012417, partial [Globisporangium polare]
MALNEPKCARTTNAAAALTLSSAKRIASGDAAPGEVDENELLAETEELLATLDATAFVCAPLAMHVNARIPHARPPRKRRIHTEVKVKSELEELRRLVSHLERQLLSVQFDHNGSKALVTREHSDRSQLWERYIERQLRLRQRAEAENKQLKALLTGYRALTDAHQQDEYLVAALPTLVSLHSQVNGRLKHRIGFSQEATKPYAFEPLLRHLDTAYADMDAVFSQNGMDRSLGEARSFAQTVTRRPSGSSAECRFIELVDVHSLPFEAERVAVALWKTVKSLHHKDNPFEFPCSDRREDTFAVGYSVLSNSGDTSQSTDLKIAMRRYFEDDRFVIVWAAQSDGKEDLEGVYTAETGWMIVSSIGEEQEPPTAVLQACMHIVAKSRDEAHPCDRKLNALVNLV